MSLEDNIDSASDDRNSSRPEVETGLLRYVEDNPLAVIAGVFIVGVILARFAFLGNSKRS